ncbi:MAG: hypothetical protein ITD27_01820 [Nitrosospira sp.]|nr:hypothetical protein [Nitrosospira sp.]MBI0419119.1 hypothetical protein [Nitrosospira sp.]MCX7182374.1 hypothetical protein [Nitrosospira sp.]
MSCLVSMALNAIFLISTFFFNQSASKILLRLKRQYVPYGFSAPYLVRPPPPIA